MNKNHALGMSVIISVCVMMASQPVLSDERWINLGGVSTHFGNRLDTGDRYNNLNYGLGYQQEVVKDVSLLAGGYLNSRDIISGYLTNQGKSKRNVLAVIPAYRRKLFKNIDVRTTFIPVGPVLSLQFMYGF